MAAYTPGPGGVLLLPPRLRPCHNQKQVVAAAGYDPGRIWNTPQTRCSAPTAGGFTVKWDQVPQYMHLESCLTPDRKAEDPAPVPGVHPEPDIDEKKLEAIFQRTFGPQRRREYQFLAQERRPARRWPSRPPSSSTSSWTGTT